MAQTMTEKILRAHLVEGTYKTGSDIGIHIDQTLTQDATGTMVYLEFESLGIDHVKNELAVSYVDHNTVQVGFENADDHAYLQSVAAKIGAVFSRPGNGICHQVHLERFGKSGATLLGSDSHTPTDGGLGALAIGAGGLDVALAMAGRPFHLIVPKIIEIRLSGKLKPWVSAKDVILTVLEHFTVKGNVNTVFEYTGDGVTDLDVPARATICNMGAECGVTTSLFPSDRETLRFLAAQGRGEAYRPFAADKDAVYDGLFEIDLANVTPKAACPHSPGNIKDIKDLAGMEVDQVLVGSCTNSSYTDLVKTARILDGHVVSPKVSLGVAPGSREVLQMISENGILSSLVRSGARILESACGFCIGNHQSPKSRAVSLRTSNRNFEGRSGTKDAQVYLVSPETAALAAIYGKVTDSATVDIPYPVVSMPDRYDADDSMFIFPPKDGSEVKVVRGPNIGDPPKGVPLDDRLYGVATIKVGDKITTDHIMPAGARLKYRSNIPAYSTFVFENIDRDFSRKAAENRDAKVANFIIAGYSYGQGSSREHAAICPMYLGVKAVIALSIERIHQANLCNFGILPLTFRSEKDYQSVVQGDTLEMDDVHAMVRKGEFVLHDVTQGADIALDLVATDEQKEMLLHGGLLNLLRDQRQDEADRNGNP
ncbi:MAG: aconitate hydratase [Sphaerochaetaceae bacterium]